MRKFNLEEALNGKPVVTRDGRKVTELHLFKSNINYPLAGVIEGIDDDISTFTTSGKFSVYNNDYRDLFMAEEGFYGFKEGENVYILEGNGHIGCYLFNNIHSEYIKSHIFQGNAFKTREEAEKEHNYIAAKFRLNSKMRELEWSWKANWNDASQNKCCFYYSYRDSSILFDDIAMIKFLDDWRYSNKETIKWVIENMQDDIKTVLGVK